MWLLKILFYIYIFRDVRIILGNSSFLFESGQYYNKQWKEFQQVFSKLAMFLNTKKIEKPTLKYWPLHKYTYPWLRDLNKSLVASLKLEQTVGCGALLTWVVISKSEKFQPYLLMKEVSQYCQCTMPEFRTFRGPMDHTSIQPQWNLMSAHLQRCIDLHLGSLSGSHQLWDKQNTSSENWGWSFFAELNYLAASIYIYIAKPEK